MKNYSRHIFGILKKLLPAARKFFSLPEKHTLPATQIQTILPETEYFVIWDTGGDGRLVGVFVKEETVKSILKINPNYYRAYKCKEGKPTPQALHWLDDRQKNRLLKYCGINPKDT